MKEKRNSFILKPCPFCGNNPILDDYGSDGKIVICKKCGIMTKFFDSENEATEIWNKRYNPFCEACKEKDCVISPDGTCEMIRKYLKYIKDKEP